MSRITLGLGTLGSSGRESGQGARLSGLPLVGLLATVWLLIIGVLAAYNAYLGIQYGSYVSADPERLAIRFNLAVVATGMALSAAIGLLAPGWWRRAMLGLAILPPAAMVVTTHNVTAVLTALAILAPVIWLGRRLASIAGGQMDAAYAWTIGGGLGFSIIAFLAYVTGIFGHLRPYALWPALIVMALVLVVVERQRLGSDVSLLASWLCAPVTRNLLGFVLAGTALAYVWFIAGGALSPEVAADAVVQRLAAANRFALNGRLAAGDPSFLAAREPAAGEAIFSVTLALGPLQTAKVLNVAAGFFALAAVYGIGRRLANGQAGGLAAFAFITIPQLFVLFQTTYVDMLATFFGVMAVLALVLPERPDARAALTAAVFIGLGVAVKLHFGYVAIGLAVMMALLLLGRASLTRTALLVALLGSASVVVAMPWLARTFLAANGLHALSLASNAISGQKVADLSRFGYGRSLINLIRLPYDFTFLNPKFGSTTVGGMGYLILALTPLLALGRSRRTMVAVLAGTLVMFLFWFYTAQYLRYATPMLGILCAVGAAAYISATARVRSPTLRIACSVLLLAVAAAGVGVRLKEPSASREYLLGQVDRETFLKRVVSGYEIAQLINADPQATRAFALTDYPQLYSRVGIRSLIASMVSRETPPVAEDSDEAVMLGFLDGNGYSHIIVDRGPAARLWLDAMDRYTPQTNASPQSLATLQAYGRFLRAWDETLIRGEEFLRRNTDLVGKSGSVYLYRLLPPNERGGDHPWAVGEELIANGGFESKRGDLPLGWTSGSRALYDTSGSQSAGGASAVRVSSSDVLSTSAPVSPNVPYLLTFSVRGDGGEGIARPQIAWLDAYGSLVAMTIQPTFTTGSYRQQSILDTAPPGSAMASITVGTQSGGVWYDKISFRSVPPSRLADERINLIEDPDFSRLRAQAPSAWKQYGAEGGRPAGLALSPLTNSDAASAWPESGFWQLAPVEGGRSYRLSYRAWSDDPAAEARLQINWFGADNQPITSTIRAVDVGSRPSDFSTWMDAPPNAARAQVYVSVQNGGPIWFDHYALRAEAPAGNSP